MSNTLKIEDLRIGQAVEVLRYERWLLGTVIRLTESGASVRLTAAADRESFGSVLVCGAGSIYNIVASVRLPLEQATDDKIRAADPRGSPEFNAGERVVYQATAGLPNMTGVVESGTCVNGRWSYAIKLDMGCTVGHVRACRMQREDASIGERFARAIDEAVGKAIEPLMLRQGTQRAVIDTTRAELSALREDVQRRGQQLTELRDVLERLREVLK